MAGGIRIEAAAFVHALTQAYKDFDVEAEDYVEEVGGRVVDVAQALVPRRTSELADSIGMEIGRDAQGPYAEVGTDNDHAIYVEFGTYKDRAQPFMRPALAAAARGLRAAGGRRGAGSRRSALFVTRARKRAQVRRELKAGRITGAEAREVSRLISRKFQFRARRRRFQ